MSRIAIVTATPMTIEAFLQDQVRALAQSNRITLFFAGHRDFSHLGARIRCVPIEIERDVCIWKDLRALAQLTLRLRMGRFDLVHSVTPKAGLLSMIAGRLARTPCRVHTFTGQVWATRSGIARRALRMADRITALNATHILVDSRAQQEFLVSERVIPDGRSRVLADGSIGGVDTRRFRRNIHDRSLVREELAIDENELVFIFVGRLKRDKGVADLVDALKLLPSELAASSRLLFVGPDEGHLCEELTSRAGGRAENLLFVDYTTTPERYLAAADIYCLPSYREGFGSSVIEAAAAGLPAVVSRIYGLLDASVDGETALFHDPGDSAAIAGAMTLLGTDPALRTRLGEQARKRAELLFSEERITRAIVQFYDEVLTNHSEGTSCGQNGGSA